jgi:hypothetical protein
MFDSENEEMKELKGQTKIYYQVLMDNRDSPYTVSVHFLSQICWLTMKTT